MHIRPTMLFVLLAAASVGAFAQFQPDSFLTDRNGLAIQGYDPVAYFTRNAAVKGDPAIVAEFLGVRFHFSSQEHRRLFSDDPERYLPQYGGWCAWAASQNSLAVVDPTAFVVHDGKLYLNYSGFINLRFRARLGHNIEQADANWPALADEAARRR